MTANLQARRRIASNHESSILLICTKLTANQTEEILKICREGFIHLNESTHKLLRALDLIHNEAIVASNNRI